jgi:uncharacterized membrane protein
VVRTFVVLAAIFGIAYVFVTPLLEVPDEGAHYFRACAIGHGAVQPKPQYGQGLTAIPGGTRELVTIGGMPIPERHRAALAVPYIPERVFIRYPLVYSPLPYLPQAIGCAIGDALRLRPLFTFYLGRLMNLAAGIALTLLAMRIAPGLRWIIAACALMPMTLFLFASFSSDATTIGVAFVATALAIAGSPWVLAAAVALALCKPAYLLIPLVALTSKQRWLIMPAIIVGGFIGASFVKTTAFMHPGVDPHAQIAFVMHHPLRVIATMASDVFHRAPFYFETMVGRLGWLNVTLPQAVIFAFAALLIAVALLAGSTITRTQRALAALAAIASIAVVQLSQYIIWTPVGANTIDGVQGRYFIPILPLILIAISRSSTAPRWLPAVIAIVAAISNLAALFALRS